MQQGSDSANGATEAAGASSPSFFASPHRENMSPPLFICGSGEYATPYTSVFSSEKSSLLSFPNNLRYSTSVSLASCEDESDDAAATEHGLYLARLTLQYEEMVDRYELCLSHLEEAVAEAEALRLHNAKLRVANAELAMRLSFLSSYGKRGGGGGLMEAAAGCPSNLLSELHRLQLGSDSPPSYLCPTSTVSDFRMESRLTRETQFPEQRSTLPKSISIRSSGSTKMPASSRSGRTRVCNPVPLGPQKVFVPVEQDEGDADERKKETEREAARLELEVYAQGMFKTELCNKWQESGSCPYGQYCQFAHGIAELRPVIRHHRYKTEICRMILGRGTCPYGHRCHFRHALTPDDYGLPDTQHLN